MNTVIAGYASASNVVLGASVSCGACTPYSVGVVQAQAQATSEVGLG